MYYEIIEKRPEYLNIISERRAAIENFLIGVSDGSSLHEVPPENCFEEFLTFNQALLADLNGLSRTMKSFCDREIRYFDDRNKARRSHSREPAVNKPINILIQAPPGAGKTKLVKSLISKLRKLDEERSLSDKPLPISELIEVNCSNVLSYEEVIPVFERMVLLRQNNLVPVVFFDEVDINNWPVFQYMLMPMYDGSFLKRGYSVEFGFAFFFFSMSKQLHRSDSDNQNKRKESAVIDCLRKCGEYKNWKSHRLTQLKNYAATHDNKMSDFLSRVHYHIVLPGIRDHFEREWAISKKDGPGTLYWQDKELMHVALEMIHQRFPKVSKVEKNVLAFLVGGMPESKRLVETLIRKASVTPNEDTFLWEHLPKEESSAGGYCSELPAGLTFEFVRIPERNDNTLEVGKDYLREARSKGLLDEYEEAEWNYRAAIRCFGDTIEKGKRVDGVVQVATRRDRGNAYAGLGALHGVLGQNGRAERTYRSAIKDFNVVLDQNSDDFDARESRANTYCQLGKLLWNWLSLLESLVKNAEEQHGKEEANRVYQLFKTACTPHVEQAELGLAVILFKDAISAYSNAIADFEHLLRRKCDKATVLNKTGNAYLNLGLIQVESALVQPQSRADARDSFEKSIRNYEKALECKDMFTFPQVSMGYAYVKLGQLQELDVSKAKDSFVKAISACEEAIRWDKNNIPAHNNRGLAYFELGKLQEDPTDATISFRRSIMEYTEVLNQDLLDWFSLFHRGNALKNLARLHRHSYKILGECYSRKFGQDLTEFSKKQALEGVAACYERKADEDLKTAHELAPYRTQPEID